ncbi:hypothetical protein BA059_27960 [Mycolicibacterium sp. (ex Dasyatis americana)]|jgi:hypothetical protein|nr:hypothetical protein A5668_25135 [Mycolicibacterium fortuitum]OBK58453.1 hypothetical protein A5654_32930 [Mycolicibacterium fortuitum]OFB35783.1 hypothetical protein BA059_27960 [Mycolicibacterium sp. (ex Dasyatis americana)]
MELPDMSDLPPGVRRVVEAMHGMARHTITATTVGLEPLDREQRLELLSGIDSTAVLVALGEMQAELDAALLSSAETVPIEARRIVDSQWYEPVRQQLAAGHRLAPPQTMVRLMREIIEAGEGPRLGIEDDDALLQLLLSVTEDHDTSSGSAARFSAMDMRQMDAEMRAMPEDELIEFANEMAVDEAASIMFNASRLPEHMKCMTHEFWYQPWAQKVGDQLGETPADTFREATGISMDDFLRAGDVIMSVLRTGRARFDLGALHEHGVSDEVAQYIKRNMVRDLDEFRAMSRQDRERGDVRAQRYTFTRFPFLDLGDCAVLALRAQWGMDRFFGNAPEFDVQQGFVEQGKPERARQFQDAVKHQFEQIVGRMVARIAANSAVFGSIVGEEDMQAAWPVKRGQQPKACDWMLPTNTQLVWLIDATHRPLRQPLAEGWGSGAEFASNLEAFLTSKKARQFESVIDQLIERGWDGASFTDTTFAPFVVVPDVGLPSTPMSMMLVGFCAREMMAAYGGRMLAPAVVSISDLMLLEGMGETPRVEAANLIRAWRQVGVMPLQQYLEACRFPYRPCPQHMVTAAAELDARIRP